MNYSWMAYEHGLQLLVQHFAPEHPAYTTVDSLRTRLLQNILYVQTYGDTDDFYMSRKTLLVDLHNCSKQTGKESFIELCVSTSPVLTYLTSVYKTVLQARQLFSKGEIWTDQCKNIIEQFQIRSELDHITMEIADITVDLYLIDQYVTDLIELLENFKAYCQPNHKPTDRYRSRQAEILQKLKLPIQEVQRIDTTFFEGLISWYQETNIAHERKPSSITQLYQPFPHSSTEIFAKDDLYISKATADIPDTKKQDQSINHNVQSSGNVPDNRNIDQTALRKALLGAFRGKGDLKVLCADVTQALREQSIIDLVITLDALEGTTLTEQILSLIETLDQHNCLSYLPLAARKSRPRFTF